MIHELESQVYCNFNMNYLIKLLMNITKKQEFINLSISVKHYIITLTCFL